MTHTAEYQRTEAGRSESRKTAAYAALSATTPIQPYEIERRAPRPSDVVIDILYCGVCHSDIHQARDEWGGSIFPMVPGHEIAGVVRAVGPKVTKYKVGDHVGVARVAPRGILHGREGLHRRAVVLADHDFAVATEDEEL